MYHSGMRHGFLFLALSLLLVGCNPPAAEDAGATPDAGSTPAVEGGTAPAAGGSGDSSQGNVGVMPSAAGGMAPVQNPEALQGAGGGGVQQAAKDRARNVGGATSADQMPTDE